jgi:hypothetical protein
MKKLTVVFLAIILVAVMTFAGINGLMNDHATGPLFIFLAVCTATGLSIDINRLVKDHIRKNNVRKFGR